MAWRKPTQLERDVLHRMLAIDDPRSNRFVSQLEDIVVESDAIPDWIFLSTPDDEGRAERRDAAHGIDALGHYRNRQNKLILFVVFFDGSERLSALEVIDWSGNGSWRDDVVANDIVVSTEAQ